MEACFHRIRSISMLFKQASDGTRKWIAIYLREESGAEHEITIFPNGNEPPALFFGVKEEDE